MPADETRVPVELPAMPEGAETVDFEAERDRARKANPLDAEPQEYWGVAEGEAMEILWEDLMPEGAEEELNRQYEAFFADLERRYSANQVPLSQVGNVETIEEGSALDFMPQLGTFDAVEDLDGQRIRIPGYVVPFDFDLDRTHAEFLFVPYMGACIHTPPPPPNQIIFVRADPTVRIRDIWVPYWLDGTLQVERNDNDLGNTAYALELEALDEY